MLLNFVWKVPCKTKISHTKKKSPACNTGSAISSSRNKTLNSSNAKSTPVVVVVPKATCFPQRDQTASTTAALPCCTHISPIKSDRMSVSINDTMSSCDSFKSHEIEYIDNGDVSALDSIDRNTFSSLNISDKTEPSGLLLKIFTFFLSV